MESGEGDDAQMEKKENTIKINSSSLHPSYRKNASEQEILRETMVEEEEKAEDE